MLIAPVVVRPAPVALIVPLLQVVFPLSVIADVVFNVAPLSVRLPLTVEVPLMVRVPPPIVVVQPIPKSAGKIWISQPLVAETKVETERITADFSTTGAGEFDPGLDQLAQALAVHATRNSGRLAAKRSPHDVTVHAPKGP